LLIFEVKEKDPFFLDVHSCSPSVIKLLNTIEMNREAIFQKGDDVRKGDDVSLNDLNLNDNDKLVLSNYSAVYGTKSYEGYDGYEGYEGLYVNPLYVNAIYIYSNKQYIQQYTNKLFSYFSGTMKIQKENRLN
jgi:hypothetical protein